MPIFVLVFYNRQVKCGEEMDAIMELDKFNELSNDEQIEVAHDLNNFGRMRYDDDFKSKWDAFFISTASTKSAFH